jgi:hypothetical protein
MKILIILHVIWIEYELNIEVQWNLYLTKLNLNIIEFNSIENKWNLQIGGEGIENPLVNMVLGRKFNWKTNSKKHISMPLYSGMA